MIIINKSFKYIKSFALIIMEMMKALSKQLGGELELRNDAGLHIGVEFRIEKILSHGADTRIDLVS